MHGARLIARADAGPHCGTGHVMRCLALMQAWRARGGEPVLASAACPDNLVDRVRADGGAQAVKLHSTAGSAADADETASVAARLGAAWIAVDGYDLDAAYVDRLRRAGMGVLLLDDLGRRGRTGATIVLNQNMHAAPRLYAAEDASTLRLLGLDYFLLRSAFWSWRGWVRDVAPIARRIGIALGGADPNGHTQRLMRALDDERFKGVEIDVIVGAANPRLSEIVAAARNGRGKFRVHADVGDMARLLSGLDVLVSSAGVTAWEAAFLSTPMMLGTAGPQEEALARRLAEAQGCVHLGAFETLTDEAFAAQVSAVATDRGRRTALASACHGLIDGQGAERVVDAMLRVRVPAPC